MANEATPIETTPTKATTEAAPVAPVVAADPLASGSLLGGDVKAVDAVAEPVVEAPAGAPEKYELAAPEGMTLADDDVAAFEPIARELGLTNDAANKLMPVAAQFGQRIAAAAADQANQAVIAEVLAQRAAWADATRADPEVGGSTENHAAAMATAAKAIDRFGSPELRALLNDTGLGNNPEVIKFAHRVGKAISEDSAFHRSDAAATPKKTMEQIFYPKPATQ